MDTRAQVLQSQHCELTSWPPRQLIRGSDGAVATSFPLATSAALDTLRVGGNAVDAAVAAAWTLSVCEPSASGLGGQTTLLLYMPHGTTRIIDGHSHAPESASLDIITRSQQRNGYRSCTIPSTPATLDYARQKYGLLSNSQVLNSAIRIAEEGYCITPLQHRQTRWVAPLLRASAATAKLFLHDGAPWQPGDVFQQPVLAATLRRLADHGIDDFYHGEMARLIANDMRQNGGLITEQDLAACSLPVEREPLSIDYRGYQVVSAPRPGGGLQLLLAIKLMEALAPDGFSRESEDWYEAIAMVIYTAFEEREKSALALETSSPSPTEWTLGPRHIRDLIARMQKEDGDLQVTHPGVEEPGDTTHLTVTDNQGNVVALTQSIQSLFGAKVANPALGFFYNNYLRTCPRSFHPCQLGSRSQPRSNVAPTLVFGKGPSGKLPILALGAAGSRRIASAILQVFSGVLDRGLSLSQAVAAPRVHALLSRKIWIERPAASDLLLKRLEQKFSKPIIKRSNSYGMGCVQALQWLPDGSAVAAADPRRDGQAMVLDRKGQEESQ
jgi:gamma-glutamyltranspeptidase / glutathione hydrolase